MANLQKILDFYGFETAVGRFHCLSSKRRKTDQHADQRWQRNTYEREEIPVVAFGSGMFGKDSVKFKGNRTEVTGILYRALKIRERQGNIIVIIVDQFRTSEVKALFSNFAYPNNWL